MADKSDADAEVAAVVEAVEPAELLKNIELTTGKAAQFCGVSRRQLCYWTDTGIVSALEDDDDDDPSSRRSYDFDALHRVLLIKQALENSAGLRRAARDVDQYLAHRRRRAEELAASIEQKRDEFLTEQADRLDALVARIQQLASQLQHRDQLAELHQALDWLDSLADRVESREVLLEEDPQTCLRLASLVEQAEAKLEAMSPSD